MPKYKVNGRTFNIPDNEVDLFEADFPEAQLHYQTNDGRKFTIYANERKDFLSDFPDATELGWSETIKEQAKQADPFQPEDNLAQPMYGSMSYQDNIGKPEDNLYYPSPLSDEGRADYEPISAEERSKQEYDMLMRQLNDFDAQNGNFMNTYEAYEKAAKHQVNEGGFALDTMEREYVNANSNDYHLRKQERDALNDRIKNNSYFNKMRMAEADAANETVDAISNLMAQNEAENTELHKKMKAMNALAMNPRGSFSGFSKTKEMQDYVDERDDLLTAKRLYENTAQVYAAPINDGEDILKKFGQGFVQRGDDLDFWTMGIVGIADDMNARAAFQKIQDKFGSVKEFANLTDAEIDALLTPSEQLLISAVMDNNAAQYARMDNTAGAYKAGAGAADSLMFMAQFLLTGGVGDAATVGTAAHKRLVNWLGRKVGSMSNGLIKDVARGAVKLGVGTAESIGKALVMTPLMPHTYANIADKIMSFDDNGELMDVTDAILTGAADALIETWSESTGDFVNKILGVPGGITKGIAKKALKNVDFSDWGKAMNAPMMKILKKGGFNGFLGEMGEEFIGNAVRSISGLEPDAFKEFTKLENLLVTAGSFAPMTIFGLGTSSAQYGLAKRKLNNAQKAFESMLRDASHTEDQVKYIVDELLGSTDAHLTPERLVANFSPLLRELAFNDRYANNRTQTMQAAVDFMWQIARYRTFDGVYHRQEEQQRNDMLAEIQEGTGREFWTTRLSENAGLDGTAYETNEVRAVEFNDGRVAYVLGGDGVNNTVVYNDGQTGFLSEEQLNEGKANGSIVSDATMGLNDYLTQQVARVRMTEEEQRMFTERNTNIGQVRAQFPIDATVELGTTEAPIQGVVRQQTPNGVIVESPAGISQLTWEELGHTIGVEVNPQTDAQMEEEAINNLEIADLQRRRAREQRRAQRNAAAEAVLTEEQMVDEAENEGLEKPVPMKADGTVDQTAFWNESPARWAQWKTEQRQDGGAYASTYIQNAIGILEGQIAESEAAFLAESDFDAKDALEQTINQQRARLAELQDLAMQYMPSVIPAETSAEASAEQTQPGAETSQPAAVMADRQKYELDAEYQRRLSLARALAEKEMILKEYFEAISAGSMEAVVMNKQNYKQVMKDMGCDESAIEMVTNAIKFAEEENKAVDALHVNDKIFIVSEYITSIEGGRVSYVHERQHNITKNRPELVQRILSLGLGRETMQKIVRMLSGSEFYEKKSDEVLADEILSFTMEIAYTFDEFSVTLSKLGIPIELINLINEINDEQRKDFTLVNARRNANALDAGQRDSGQNDRDSGEVSGGILGQEGVRPSEDSERGAEAGESGEPATGGAEASEEGLQVPVAEVDEESELDAETILNEDGFETDEQNEDVRFSVRYLPTPEQREGIIGSIIQIAGRTREEAERWLESELSLASIVLNDKEYLDYAPDAKYKAIKDNSDYPQGTVDFNNICRKRKDFTRMYTRLQRSYPNRIFTAEDLADIRTIMSEDGLVVACGLCYVEDRRQKLGEVADEFIKDLQDGFKSYGKKNATKRANAEKFRSLVGEDTYVPSIYDLITLEGSDKLHDEHKGIWDAFGAYNRARGQQTQNTFQGYAEYKREILTWSDAKVKKVNSLGGLRIFSYSDFEAHHLLDIIQIIIDCAARGVMIQGYTKVPEFARVVEKTGIKLNRSLIPLGDTGIVDGKLAYDPVEGIDINDPNFLESNDNIGNILIGINDEQIRMAMADPFIHYIIPYHARQAGNIRAKLNVGAWINYIDTQNERKMSDGKRVEKNINIYTDVLNESITNDREFVEKYLEVCREKGYIPKFDQFLDRDAEGNYVYTPGYYKFLVDFKLFDEAGNILPQKPVVAQFDDAFNAQVLLDYAREERETAGEAMNSTYDKIVETLDLGEPTQGEDVRFRASEGPIDLVEEARKADLRHRVAAEGTLIPGHKKGEPMLSDAEMMADAVSFRITKNTRATIESWCDKAGLDEDIKIGFVDHLEFTFDDATEQLCAAKWYLSGKINLPNEDEYKVRDAVKVAKRNKVDALSYESPMDILNTFGQPKEKVKPINPDNVPTLKNRTEVPGTDIVIYDVEESEESRENMREIINTHYGKNASPWCLLQGNEDGKLTKLSAEYWQRYSAYPKKVAFKGGRLLAFSANSSKEITWWDRQDHPYNNIPVTQSLNDEKKRKQTVEINPKTGKETTRSGIFSVANEDGYTIRRNWNKIDGPMVSAQKIKDGQVKALFNRYTKDDFATAAQYLLFGRPKGLDQVYTEEKSYAFGYNGALEFYNTLGYKVSYTKEAINPWSIITKDSVIKEYTFNKRGKLVSFFDGSKTIKDRKSLAEVEVPAEFQEIVSRDPKSFMADAEQLIIDAGLADAYKESQSDVSFRITPEQDKAYMDAVEAGDMETAQRMVDEAAEAAGYTIRGDHGRVSKFTIFDRDKANPEGNWGQGFYFTNNEEDVEENYATVDGPDLEAKIEREVEKRVGIAEMNEEFNEDGEVDEFAIREEVEKEFITSEPNIVHAAIKMDKPFVVGHGMVVSDEAGNTSYDMQETYLDVEYEYDEDGEIDYYSEPTGTLIDLINALNEEISNYDWANFNANEILQDAYDGMTASQFESAARELLNSHIDELVNDRGDVMTSEILRAAIERAGFDGIIDNTVNQKFGTQRRYGQSMAGMDSDTRHYISFDSSNIKDTDPVTYDNDGNVIPLSERFNPENEDIRFRMSNNNQAIFVSNAAKAVEGIKQEKATPEQWLKMLEKAGGLKAGEDKWMGLSDWLKASDKKTLTKAEVLDFINENMIVIEETHYDINAESDAERVHGEITEKLRDRFDHYVDEYYQDKEWDDDYTDEAREYAIEKLREEMGDTFPYTIEREYGSVYLTFPYEEESDLVEWAEKTGVEYTPGVNPINDTRLVYTTDGLENRHEIALTVPTIESWGKEDTLHFGDAGEGRVVAWIRFGETEVPTGEYKVLLDEMNRLKEVARELYEEFGGRSSELAEVEERQDELRADLRSYKNSGLKVLVIDEIQSKRHQEGREKGYKPDWRGRKKLRENLEKADREVERIEAEMIAKYGSIDKIVSSQDFDALEAAKEARREARLEFSNPHYGAIPDAPFDKNWHELAMKRMLRYAAENGYDIIAWTKGEQQTERYGLGGYVSSIEMMEEHDGIIDYLFYVKGREESSIVGVEKESGLVALAEEPLSQAEGKPLSDLVGKEMAVRMMQMQESEVLEGANLQIGGEGMKGFYDKMLPAFMNKYGKKWGIKVEDIDLPELEDGLTMHSVPVTEEMKATVMEGQVMFRMRGENESARDFVQSVIDETKYAYPFVNPIRVDEVTPEVATRYGKTFERLQKTSAIFVRNNDLIVIFAHESVDDGDKVKRSIFHEATHKAIKLYELSTRVGKFFWDHSNGVEIFEDAKSHIMARYAEEKWHEEMMCTILSAAIITKTAFEIASVLPTDLRNDVELILNNIGYGRERKRSKIYWTNTATKDGRKSQSEGSVGLGAENGQWNIEKGLTAEERRIIREYFPTFGESDVRMRVNSHGKDLTEGQQEFFANSKAVDKDGNLLVLYHGTPRAGFAEFKSGFFTTSKEDAISYSGDRKGRLFDPNEKYEPETLVAGDFPLGYMTFDSEEDRAAFIERFPYAEDAMSEREYEETRMGAEDDEYDALTARRKEFAEVWNAYREYERERFVDTTIGDLLANPEAYTEEDLMRAMMEYDSNASFDNLDDMSAEERRDALVSALQNANEEAEGGILDMVVPTRVPRNGEGQKHNDLGNRTYEVYANIERPYEIDANGRGSEFVSGDVYRAIEDGLASEEYDGVIVRNWRTGRHQQLGDVVIPKNGSQIKLTSNENPSEGSDIRFRTSLELDEEFGDAWRNQQNEDGRHSTQVANTKSTYEKIGRYLEDAGMKGASILDASSGLGLGTQALREMGFQVDDVEPFPSENREAPTFSSYADIDGKYDVVISNAVLNVIPDDWRADVLHQMADAVKEGGKMIINTRPASNIAQQGVEGKTRITLDSPSEILVKRGDRIAAYQKGFTSEELAEWIKSELGEGWRVEKATKKNSGISGEGTAVVIKESDDTRFRVTGTPTEDVVAEGVSLSPAQLASLAGDIFAALPEESRKKITDGLNGNILGLQDAILQIPTSLAAKEEWNDEDRQMAEVVAEQMTKAVDIEMTRPFSAFEALWTLYNAVNKSTDLVSEASRALVRRNLGFDSQTLEMEKDARDGVRFRTVGNASANAQASMYNRGAANVWTRLKESFVDMHASVEKLVKAIEKRSGKKAEGFENILMALNQQSSKGLAAMEAYEQKFLNEMFDEIRWIMDKTDFKYEDIVRYVILKHGLERNEKMAQRDAKAHYQEIYDDIIAKIKGMNPAQKRTYLTNAQLRDADAKAELARLQGVNTSALTPDQLRDHKKELAKAKKEATEAAEHLVKAQKVATLTEQDAQDELDKIFKKIEKGTDSVYKEMRKNDYSGISSMFYDTLGVDRKNYATEEEYQSALMQAKADKYDNLGDIEGAAQMEVTLFENTIQTNNLWKSINKATKETLRQQYEANMISKDQYLNLRDMFEFYVPLRGFADNTAEDMYTYYRKPNSTGYTKPILGAEGRKTEAESPFGWIAAMAGSAIASNVKNEAKLALYYFVANRPDNGIATLSRTWFVHTPGDVDANGKKIFRPAYPPFNEDLSSASAKADYEIWQANMRNLQSQGLAYEAGQRLDLGNSVVNISDTNKPEHIVNVKVGGKDYTIVINGNPRAAQAINGDLNIESSAQDYSSVFGPMLRWMSSVNTSYNPEFWITNMMRDMAFTWMAVNIKEDPAYRRKFKKNYAKAFKVISMVAKNENGTLGNSYIERMYKDFVKYGGVTGYTQIKDSETWEKEIENYLTSNDPASIRNGKIMRGMKSAFHAAHRFGESLEQVSRFAAFLTAVETGKSINEAINDAKEITVNFNRKGSGKMITLEEAKYLTDKNGQPLNKLEQWAAVGFSSIAPLGRRAIMFFNAAIQGLNATYQLWKKNKLRSIGWVSGYVAIGALNAVLHAMLDDDDDYLDIPQYERRNSLMIGGNGAYFKWALPQEARAFYALGDLAVESVMGRNPHQSVIGEALKISTEILPINPSEGWKAFMPSVAIPLVELALNEDYKGAPIYNEQKWLTEEEKKRSTKWSKAYSGTGDLYIGIAKVLNAVTGGDEHDAGLVNLQPEKIEHIVQSAFGGTIRTADKFINTIMAAFDPEEDVTIRQLPFLNRILTINDERYKNVHVNDVYDYYAAEAEHAISLQKQYTKDRNSDALKDLRSSEEYKWARIYSKYKKPIKKYQEAIRAADTTNERMELMKQQDELKRKMIKEISEL